MNSEPRHYRAIIERKPVIPGTSIIRAIKRIRNGIPKEIIPLEDNLVLTLYDKPKNDEDRTMAIITAETHARDGYIGGCTLRIL